MGGGSYDRSVYSSGDGRSSGGWSSSYSGGSSNSSKSSGRSASSGSSGSSRSFGGSSRSSSRSSSGFDYSAQADKAFESSTLNSSLFPKRRELVCKAQTGIVIVLDHTGSMGDSAKTIYDKMPMFYGQIEQKGYLKNFAISFAAVGDVNSDQAPLQVCDFAKGIELDKKLKQLYLEGGGGGQKMESYELMALYYLRHASFSHRNASKPFIFFIGDEGFYSQIRSGDVARHLGDSTEDLERASRKVFEELRKKYHAFMIHIPYAARSPYDRPRSKKVVSSYPDSDRRICQQWKEVFGQDFMTLDEPKGIVDVILGCIAVVGETRTLEEYLDDMKGRDQSVARVSTVERVLRPKSQEIALRQTEAPRARLPKAAKKVERSQRI